MIKKVNLERAKNLWVQANELLDTGNIGAYLKAATALHRFMKDEKIGEDDLRPELSDKTISPKGFSILQEIWLNASDYSRASATLTESSVEPGLASAVNNVSAFFMGCKLGPNERATPDSDFKLGKATVLVGIMQFIRDVVDQTSKIWMHNTKALIGYKIALIHSLEKSDNINNETLEDVLSSKGEDLTEYLTYEHATLAEGREHRYTASTENFKALKAQYSDLRGDALKTGILINFKNKLTQAVDSRRLDSIVKELKESDEYKILKTGQGLATRMFGLKTSSVAAFERIIEEVRDDIDVQNREHFGVK